MRSGRKSRSPAPPSVSPDSEVARHLDVRDDSGSPTTGIRGIRLSPAQNSPVSSVIPPFIGDYPDTDMQSGPVMQPLATPNPLPLTPARYGSDPGYGRHRHHPISPNVIDIGQSPMMPQAEIEVASPFGYDNHPVLTRRPQHASHAAPTVWTPRPQKVDPFAPPILTQSPQHTSYAPGPTMVTPMDRNSYVSSPAYGLGPMGVSHRHEYGAPPQESVRRLIDNPNSRPKGQFPSGNKWDANKGRPTGKPSPPTKGNCFYCGKARPLCSGLLQEEGRDGGNCLPIGRPGDEPGPAVASDQTAALWNIHRHQFSMKNVQMY